MPSYDVVRATAADLERVAPLFDAYRVFYGQPADLDRARRFLDARFAAGESIVLIARAGSEAVGFAQLYPSFTSVGTDRIFILNDLFVDPAHRGAGVGGRLLRAADEVARAAGAVRLELTTERDNTTAQALYERSGYERDDVFVIYRRTPA